jgi:2-oxoglutarate ferredoxin oxidoreductase subunit alpha
MAKKLLKGCEAIGEAAVRSGCRLFFGYPITPQNEIPEYLAHRLPQVGGRFVQAESEVAASNMIYGAAGAGERVFTSSSSPGISLMQEAVSYLAAAELPVVLVNIMRAGPGLGGILPGQADYFQATRGGGHGDYHLIVLAPSSVQEAADLIQDAFDLADFYRTPVMILGDGLIGQMMEPVEFREDRKPCRPLPEGKPWATTGWKGDRPRAVINSLFLDPEENERHNNLLQQKYDTIRRDEIRYQTIGDEGEVDVLVVAYGTVARVCQTGLDDLKEAGGAKTALFRPISLFPFPYAQLSEAAKRAKHVLVVELSAGQMLQDVQLATRGSVPLHFHGRTGGMLIAPDDVALKVRQILAGESREVGNV